MTPTVGSVTTGNHLIPERIGTTHGVVSWKGTAMSRRVEDVAAQPQRDHVARLAHAVVLDVWGEEPCGIVTEAVEAVVAPKMRKRLLAALAQADACQRVAVSGSCQNGECPNGTRGNVK
jgi:hypothetical protein